MSLDEFKGSTYAYRELMRQAQADIDAGERKGATVKFKTAHPKIKIGWFHRRVLRGEFRKERAR